ncbi:MAG: FKBP-type peptidyl-prolyl cis-trans isomerase [Leptospirales bacterium]|nr:FKBP-type peptidyl-prolyl cis-trans isomerase [Leptospirales bacterium]
MRPRIVSGILLLALIGSPTLFSQTGSLIATDTRVGNGKEARRGMDVRVHYTGWLYVDGKKGRKFDSSLDRGQPFDFALGGGEVIKGWDQGVVGMKEGGKRTLIIPPQLAYGERGAGDVIPPNATLLFEIQLIKCSESSF